MKRIALASMMFTLLLTGSPLLAQEWRLDDSLRALGERELDRLVDGVSEAPEKALRAVLEEEGEHLEKLAKSELEPFAREAWGRIQAQREEGRLWRAIRDELQAAGVLSRELLRKVWEEEKARLHTVPERTVNHLVDRAMKAVLIDRLTALRNARLTAWRADTAAGDARNGGFPLSQPNEHFAWSEREGGNRSAIEGSLPLPNVKFFSEKATLEEVLYERTYETKLGRLKVTAAEVEGVANAKAGRVSYRDDFGNEVEGLGVTFTARAKLTGVEADYRSHDFSAIKGDLGIRSHLSALASLASNVEASSTTVITERGIGSHTAIRAGAGARAVARLPITIDLKVLTLRVIPYAEAHAGVSADAHATFEVEWTGKLRMDIGAHLSTGVGAGAGIIVEVELGPVLKRALERLTKALAKFVRPIADGLMGRRWEGPAVDGDRLTLGLDDLERRWAETGEPAPARNLSSPAAIAQRYAPVIYQEVDRGKWDLLRRIDFDGDWDTLNNWDHTTEEADRSAWVYYDVRETKTHYYVSYVFYHSGRHSNAIKPLRHFRRHENDMGGAIVVARKDAPRGREVEVLMTANGTSVDVYSGLERRNGKKTRWSRNHGSWHGDVRFVDEVDHPLVDLERTHPQVWISGKDHDVHGFTGRNDHDPFDGEDGIVYVPTGSAESPESYRDAHVGYALRPLSELVDQLGNERVFAEDTVTPRGGRTLPARLRGDEGVDDKVALPWAWRNAFHEEDRHNDRDSDPFRRDDHEWIEAGDTFVNPARTLAILFDVPGDFSQRYVSNPYLKGGARPTGTHGMSAELASAVGE